MIRRSVREAARQTPDHTPFSAPDSGGRCFPAGIFGWDGDAELARMCPIRFRVIRAGCGSTCEWHRGGCDASDSDASDSDVSNSEVSDPDVSARMSLTRMRETSDMPDRPGPRGRTRESSSQRVHQTRASARAHTNIQSVKESIEICTLDSVLARACASVCVCVNIVCGVRVRVCLSPGRRPRRPKPDGSPASG